MYTKVYVAMDTFTAGGRVYDDAREMPKPRNKSVSKPVGNPNNVTRSLDATSPDGLGNPPAQASR